MAKLLKCLFFSSFVLFTIYFCLSDLGLTERISPASGLRPTCSCPVFRAGAACCSWALLGSQPQFCAENILALYFRSFFFSFLNKTPEMTYSRDRCLFRFSPISKTYRHLNICSSVDTTGEYFAKWVLSFWNKNADTVCSRRFVKYVVPWPRPTEVQSSASSALGESLYLKQGFLLEMIL